jgi:hypothetical protein
LLPAEAGGSAVGSAAIFPGLGTRAFFCGCGSGARGRSIRCRAASRARLSATVLTALSPPLAPASAIATWRTAAI